MEKIVSKAEFARMAGVSGTAVSKALTTPLLDRAAFGKRVDAAHPDAVTYLNVKRKVGVKPPPPPPPPPLQSVSPSVPPSAARPPHQRGAGVKKENKKRASTGTIDIPDDIREFEEFSLRDIIDKFGTDVRFVDFLSAVQKIEAINEKRLKNAQTKGELISRTLVQNGVIDVFNSAHLRLLKDGAKSIAAGAVSKHASGANSAEVEAFVSDILGSFIRPVKNKITRALKNA